MAKQREIDQAAQDSVDEYINKPTKLEKNTNITNQCDDQMVGEPQRLHDNYAFTEHKDFKTTVCSSDKSYLTEKLSVSNPDYLGRFIIRPIVNNI